MHSGCNASLEEEDLFSMFRAWVFYQDSRLFELETETIQVVSKKKVVKSAKTTTQTAKKELLR
jgi:hypothetical protein